MEDKNSSISLDENKFSIVDNADIKKIIINGTEHSNVLSNEKTLWLVNEKYPMDPSMQKVLMSVLNQVKVKRTVPKNDLVRIKDDILMNGFKIEIIYSDGHEMIFYAGGNGISLSYFMHDDNIPYIVHLPGYESYVTGIFEVHENDWRDRLIFHTSWLGLKSLNLSYPANPENNIAISADKDLYRISGINIIDTTRLMTYLDEISYFFTDQYVDHGQIKAYDSLIKTEPFTRLTVNSTGMKEPVVIDFFQPLPGENVMLGILNNVQMCLFSTKRIHVIFKEKDHFILK
jgi:hypothetical protein